MKEWLYPSEPGRSTVLDVSPVRKAKNGILRRVEILRLHYHLFKDAPPRVGVLQVVTKYLRRLDAFQDAFFFYYMGGPDVNFFAGRRSISINGLHSQQCCSWITGVRWNYLTGNAEYPVNFIGKAAVRFEIIFLYSLRIIGRGRGEEGPGSLTPLIRHCS